MAAAAPRPVAVDVEAWGTRVFVKALTLAEAEALGQDASQDPGRRLARGLAAAMVDENGDRLFDPHSEEDLDLLGSQGMAVLNPLIRAANESNASAADSAEKLGKA